LPKKNPPFDPANLPEVFASTSETTRAVSRLLGNGRLRRIGHRLYTTNLTEPLEAVIARNRWHVVGLLAPGAVITHRTALESRAAEDGSVLVSAPHERTIELPGLLLRQVRGPGPLPGDTPFVGGLYLASRPRAFLENLAPSRRRRGVPRTVGREEVERRLSELLRVQGPEALNRLRDDARPLAPSLDLAREFTTLDAIIGALLGTRTEALADRAARAWSRGEPYDPHRLPLFDALRAALATAVHPDRPDDPDRQPAFANVAFFDAYFSNFIEGAEFEVTEAEAIVFRGAIPTARPEDAHDILGTYAVVGSVAEMRRVPRTFDELLALLQRRHARILEARPDKRPGRFKETANRAGGTSFVAPDLVRGTLREGFAFYQSLDHPFARALFLMFLVAEVHPFDDGNGRTARAMMNAELVAARQARIFVPSVFRDEYLAGLRRLTHHADPAAFVRTLAHGQELVARLRFDDLATARRALAACNAFERPGDVRLRLPGLP
jgi:hypothetical protein